MNITIPINTKFYSFMSLIQMLCTNVILKQMSSADEDIDINVSSQRI